MHQCFEYFLSFLSGSSQFHSFTCKYLSLHCQFIALGMHAKFEKLINNHFGYLVFLVDEWGSWRHLSSHHGVSCFTEARGTLVHFGSYYVWCKESWLFRNGLLQHLMHPFKHWNTYSGWKDYLFGLIFILFTYYTYYSFIYLLWRINYHSHQQHWPRHHLFFNI